jgi:uncharacterized membrane protein
MEKILQEMERTEHTSRCEKGSDNMALSMKESLVTFGILIAIFLCYVIFALAIDLGKDNNMYVFYMVTLFIAFCMILIASSWDWTKWEKGDWT